MQVPVPATIRADNSNAVNRTFVSYVPSTERSAGWGWGVFGRAPRAGAKGSLVNLHDPAVLSKEQVGITVTKDGDFSGWYTQVVIKAELADYAPVKGMMVLRPDGYSIWESLQGRLDARFAERGIRNGFLPVLIPESLLKKEEEHFAGLDPEVFWVTHSGSSEVGDRLALRPTSETLAHSMYSKWIQSWRDLPLKINFWNTALRAEIKATKPFLRTSEFLWQEGHTVHATRGEAENEVLEILEVYRRTIEEELAIPVVAGKKSEKEKFVGAVYTTTVESIMPDGKALQMGTSHFLGQNFSRPFGVAFADRDNVEHFAWQTSWGVSWRLIGAMIMVHGDDRGLVLPPRVAPVQAVVVPIIFKERDERAVLEKALHVKGELEGAGVRVHLDDRREVTPGYKFNDWELRGVPLRIEIGPRDVRDGRAVAVTRYDGKKSGVPLEGMAARVREMLEAAQNGMLERARLRSEEMTADVLSYDELGRGIKAGGFLRAHWCGERGCEERIKEDTGGEIRVIPFDGEGGDEIGKKDTGGRCVRCGGPGRSVPLFARGY